MNTMCRLVMLVVLTALAGCGQVDTGERGLFWHWGKLDPESYKPGLYFYNPISTSMRTMDVKTQKYEAKNLEAATQDLQPIHSDIVVNFVVVPDKAHELAGSVGSDYEARVLAPAIVESLKSATAHYPIDHIIKRRDALRDEVMAHLQARMQPYWIKIESISLTNFGFSKAFAEAVEQKQIQEQKVQQAEYKRQQADKDAQASVLLARGQAEANKLLAESLKQSPETIRFRELEVLEKKWNGSPPSVIFSDKASVIPNLVR